MLTIEEYKKLLGDRLTELTDTEIQIWYECHTTFVAFVLKCWLGSRGKRQESCDKLAP